MDKVELNKVVAFEASLQAFARSSYAALLERINREPKLTKEIEAELKKCLEDFVATGTY
jgi:F-type H+-transporting ATPase subunit alpha